MKKNLIYLLSAVALFASCSPAYKTSQTPDDVYYSPAKKIYVSDAVDRYESYPSSSDDSYLRMKVQDHDKWGTIDDYNYWYDSRYYMNSYYSPYTSYLSLGLGYGTYYPYYTYNTHLYNPYWYNPWSSWYNPCYTVVYYKSPAVYYKPVSKYTQSTYTNRSYNNYNMPLHSGNRSSAYNNTNYYNSNSDARTKNSYYNSNQNNSNSTPSRSFNSGSSMSSGGGGSRISGGGSRSRP